MILEGYTEELSVKNWVGSNWRQTTLKVSNKSKIQCGKDIVNRKDMIIFVHRNLGDN